MRTTRLACLLFLLAACGGGSTMPDAALSGTDAFAPSLDAPGGGGTDAPVSPTDDAATTTASDAFFSADARSTGDAACMPPMTDLSELGADCSVNACPAGLECIDFAGVVLQRYCGIRCEVEDGGDCACPAPLLCETVSDKAGPRRECVQPDI